MSSSAMSFSLPWIASAFDDPTTSLTKLIETVPLWALLIVAFFGLQIVAIVLNVLRQLVRSCLLIKGLGVTSAPEMNIVLIFVHF